ncbi:MAG: helix-turn-helix transcriptional regulator [Actinomycetota bacterium]
MQEKQQSENLALGNIIIKALCDQEITYNDLLSEALKTLDLGNEYRLKLGRLFTFLSNHSFTVSETNIFILVAKGFSNADIAERLTVSKNTVRFHLKNIYRKTAVRSRIALIKLGTDLGL